MLATFTPAFVISLIILLLIFASLSYYYITFREQTSVALFENNAQKMCYQILGVLAEGYVDWRENLSIEKPLYLPYLDPEYWVDIGCKDDIISVNITSSKGRLTCVLYLNCSAVNISGYVGPGLRCIKINNTNIVVGECGA